MGAFLKNEVDIVLWIHIQTSILFHWQQIVGSSFLIQLAKWCLLMGEFSPLTFSVSIDKYVVIPVM
jgi:predicted ABC-type exoprotein transport system permease subunit